MSETGQIPLAVCNAGPLIALAKINHLARDWTGARLELLAARTRFRDGLLARVHTEQ